jgi:Ca2+-binding RTX toxin-like protein
MTPRSRSGQCVRLASLLTMLVVVVPGGASIASAATPTCFGKAATILGTEGRERIEGTSEDDVIIGLGGRDIIFAGEGDDLVCGVRGDVIDGGPGNDSMSGGRGPDFVTGPPTASEADDLRRVMPQHDPSWHDCRPSPRPSVWNAPSGAALADSRVNGLSEARAHKDQIC